MKLTAEGIKEQQKWIDAGYDLPAFDEIAMRQQTKENPVWLHFGNGNIFKALHGKGMQDLLNRGLTDRGIIIAGSPESVIRLNRTHDEYSILVTLKSDGSVEKTVIGSIAESCITDIKDENEYSRLKEIFCNSSLQMVSFTITEKGYDLEDGRGAYRSEVLADFTAGPESPESYMGMIATLLYERYRNGAAPIAMVSFDNCSHNGDKLYEAVLAYAWMWEKNGLAEEGFVAYLQDRGRTAFPWTMIDKITPRPDESIAEIIKNDGVEDVEFLLTERKSYMAPFVNAEESETLVIEDVFPNGRPPLEACGVIFTDRETVDKVEKMKVCTCLNPLHTALAVFGCLLGYTRISEAVKDKELLELVRRIGYVEGLPVVTDPGIIKPKDFLDEVLQVRLPNPFIPDMPQRIATDTSQKLPIRFGETLKKYLQDPKLSVNSLICIPLVFAGWIRYLMAVDDKGKIFTLSADPMLDQLRPIVEQITFGEICDTQEVLKPILEDARIFGVDLYESGLAEKVCGYFDEMNAGPGAVRETLVKYLA